MSTNRLSVPDVTEIFFREIFHDGFMRAPQQIETIYNVRESTLKDEDDSRVGTLGLAEERTEGGAVVYDDPPQGFDVTYEHAEYALGYQHTLVAQEDDQHNIIAGRMPAQIGVSMGITAAMEAANDYNYGTNGSFTGGDGVSLFNTAHPLPGGGTETNRLTTLAAPSELAYENALNTLDATTDDRGKLIIQTPKFIWGHRNLRFKLARMTKSSLQPGTANNDINTANTSEYGVPFEVLHYLTNTSQWGIACEEHFMFWFWRVQPTFGRDGDFDTDNQKYKGRMRFSHGWSDFYGQFLCGG